MTKAAPQVSGGVRNGPRHGVPTLAPRHCEQRLASDAEPCAVAPPAHTQPRAAVQEPPPSPGDSTMTQPRRSYGSLGQRSLRRTQDLLHPHSVLEECWSSQPGWPDSGTATLLRGWGRQSSGAGRKLGDTQDPARGGRMQVSDPSWDNPFEEELRHEASPVQECCRSRSVPPSPLQMGLAADLSTFHVGIIHYNTGKNPRHRNARDPSAPLHPHTQKRPAENEVGFCFPIPVLRRVGLLCPLVFQCKSFSFWFMCTKGFCFTA